MKAPIGAFMHVSVLHFCSGQPPQNLSGVDTRKKQGVSADVETMDDDLQDVLDAQISVIERKIENVVAQAEPLAARANLLRSIPGIGPVSAA
jgi:transposase